MTDTEISSPEPDTALDPVQGLAAVQARLTAALERAGRPANAAELIAVTKTHSTDRIRPLLQAGHRVFGENRVQEAQAKFPDLRAEYPDLKLHLIGPLQSNKTAQAIDLFDVIESLDRPKLAQALAYERDAGRALPKLLVQVNTGEEPQKAGIFPSALPDFLTLCRDLGLSVSGLMCIPPVDDAPGPHFVFLKRLADQAGLAELSCGMSGDFETAARLGATQVRVGSAIFGAR
jgi:pyridoxal phosphate enzyme (YggS family)